MKDNLETAQMAQDLVERLSATIDDEASAMRCIVNSLANGYTDHNELEKALVDGLMDAFKGDHLMMEDMPGMRNSFAVFISGDETSQQGLVNIH